MAVSEIFLTSLITSITFMLIAALRYAYKYKFETIECGCCKIKRNVTIEQQIDESNNDNNNDIENNNNKKPSDASDETPSTMSNTSKNSSINLAIPSSNINYLSQTTI